MLEDLRSDVFGSLLFITKPAKTFSRGAYIHAILSFVKIDWKAWHVFFVEQFLVPAENSSTNGMVW